MATDTATETPPPEAPPAATEPAAPPPPASDKQPPAPDAKAKGAKQGGKAAKPAKPAKGGKAAKGAKGAKGAESGDGPSVAAHPRAVRGVARAKSWGGLLGFLLGGYLSLPTNTLAGAGARALLAGIVCYVAVWAGAVFVWRRLVMLEIKSREQQLLAAAQAEIARREAPAAPGGRPGARAAS